MTIFIELGVTNLKLDKPCGALFFLADAQNQPEEGYPRRQEQHVYQPTLSHSPAGQGEASADQYMHQEEKHQQQIRLGMQPSRQMQGKQGHIPPGIAGDDEYDHQDQEQPGGYAVDLDQNSAELQSILPPSGIAIPRLSILL